MRVTIPLSTTVTGSWECDLLGHAWSVTKTVAVWIASIFIIVLFTTVGYCIASFGLGSVLPWVLVVAVGGVVVGFGVRAVKEQPTAMGKFGAVMLVLLILMALVVGAVVFQKLTSTTEIPISALQLQSAMTPQAVSEPVAVATVPPPTPSQSEAEHNAHGSASGAQETTESPPASVVQQEINLETQRVSIGDVCDPDPGGEKASAWGQR